MCEDPDATARDPCEIELVPAEVIVRRDLREKLACALAFIACVEPPCARRRSARATSEPSAASASLSRPSCPYMRM